MQMFTELLMEPELGRMKANHAVGYGLIEEDLWILDRIYIV